MSSSSMSIADIKIGKRIRKDMGDIQSLAESIEAVGLINPITIDENGCLLAGARRLAACKLLGLKEIEVRIMRSPENGR
jgi:ParB-like chromosome segregation protein Spo0J